MYDARRITEKLCALLEFAQDGQVIDSTMKETFVDCTIETIRPNVLLVGLDNGQVVQISILVQGDGKEESS